MGQVDKLGVVGAGTMGHGIAQVAAQSGFEVTLVEKEKELGGMARRIRTTLEGFEVQPFLDDLIRQAVVQPNEVAGYVETLIDRVQ